MTSLLQIARSAAAWCRKPGGVPFLVLSVLAVASVALACLGAEGALACAKTYAVGGLAGVALLSAVVCARMTARPALLALHLGFALVLCGWVANEVAGGEEGYLKLGPGQSGDVAGMDQLTLQSFTIDRWEDTGTVRQYTSKVRNGKGEELEISVNHPLVVRPWWVYQSSYQEMADPYTGEVAKNPRTGEPLYFTMLLCVKDVGLPLVAFGAVLLLVGALGYSLGRDTRNLPASVRDTRDPLVGVAGVSPANSARAGRAPYRVVRGLYALAFLGAVSMLVHRGITTGHPPMQNMYEFLICTAALLPVLTFVSARWGRQDTLLADSILLAFVLMPVGFFMDGSVKRLMPALQSPFFVPHVGAYVIGYILLVRAAMGAGRRLVGLGFFLLTLGLVLGAWWGKVCWGHWWQFDPKEMWSLATWLLYAAYFHLRPRLSPRADRAFLVAGAVMVVLTLTWINLSRLFTGMHSYA